MESRKACDQGKALFREQRFQVAMKYFTKALSLSNQNFDAQFYRGLAALDSGNFKKAVSDFSELMEKCPAPKKNLFIALSVTYRRMGKLQDALKILSKGIQKYPKLLFIEAYIARGQIYLFQSDFEKALLDFRAVTQAEPSNPLGHLGMGDVMKGLSNHNKAIHSYTKVI